jgi:flagellin
MALRINSNVEAINAHRQLVGTNEKLSKSMQKLSSGYRINRAADDAAGLAISEKLRGQIKGISQAQRNANDAVSMVQTAEAALVEVHSMLQRVRELAVQFKNGSLSTADRTAIQSEVNQLASEIERIGADSEFNSIKLLNSTGSVTFQIGAMDGQILSVATVSLSQVIGTAAFSLAVTNAADISEVDAAINAVSNTRAQFGAIQNRLDHALANLATYEENMTASESRVRDIDMAKAMTELTKLQILQQAGTAMLAQANQSPQAVLRLLQG